MSRRTAYLSCLASYLALGVATGLAWEPAHDEGVTFTQAIAPVRIGLPPAAEPVPLRELYPALDGDAAYGAGDVLAALGRHNGMHPPAYYLALHGWASLTGTGRLALVAPVFACGALALLGMRRLGDRLAGAGAGDAAMLLLALSPWFVGFSNYARPYALAVVLTIGASVAVFEQQGSARRTPWRIAFVVLSVLGLYSLYHYAFVLAWHGGLLLALAWGTGPGRRGRELAACAAMGAAIPAAFAPWIPQALGHLETTGAGSHYFSGRAPASEWLPRIAGLLERLALGEGFRSVAAGPLRGLGISLGLATLVLLVRSLPRLRSESATARLFWLSLPGLPALALAADAWHGTHTFFYSKTSFALVPVLLLLIARAWQTPARRAVRRAGIAAWALLFGASALASAYTRATSQSDFEGIAVALADTDTAAHVLVLSANFRGHSVPLLLTLRAAGIREVRVLAAPASALDAALERLLERTDVDRVTLLDLAVPYQRVGRWHPPLLERAGRRAREAGWEVERLTPRAAASAPGRPVDSLWILSPVETGYFDV